MVIMRIIKSVMLVDLLLNFLTQKDDQRRQSVDLILERKFSEVRNMLRPLDEGGELALGSKFEFCLMRKIPLKSDMSL